MRHLKAFASTNARKCRLWAPIWAVVALAAALSCLFPSLAYGDVGVVLDESMSKDMDRITGTGHSAFICPGSAQILRSSYGFAVRASKAR